MLLDWTIQVCVNENPQSFPEWTSFNFAMFREIARNLRATALEL